MGGGRRRAALVAFTALLLVGRGPSWARALFGLGGVVLGLGLTVIGGLAVTLAADRACDRRALVVSGDRVMTWTFLLVYGSWFVAGLGVMAGSWRYWAHRRDDCPACRTLLEPRLGPGVADRYEAGAPGAFRQWAPTRGGPATSEKPGSDQRLAGLGRRDGRAGWDALDEQPRPDQELERQQGQVERERDFGAEEPATIPTEAATAARPTSEMPRGMYADR